MMLAVDVDYGEQAAVAAGVQFDNWTDDHPRDIFLSVSCDIDRYVPGEFYKRELPCILKMLEDFRIQPDVIVVDGYVYLDGVSKPGLGKYLYDALEGRAVVMGVAKNPYVDISDEFAVFRGKSKKPLYITSAGVNTATAKSWVTAMSGRYRIPTLVKWADRACRAVRGRDHAGIRTMTSAGGDRIRI